MDNKDIKDDYLNEMYIEDVCAYVHGDSGSEGIVENVKSYGNGYAVFSWPAALMGSWWYVYRGMVKEAVLFDVVTMFVAGYLFHTKVWAGLLVYAALMVWKGMAAIPSYYKRIYHAIEQRGLCKRLPEEIPAVKESLANEGKPSVVRVVLYLLVKCLAIVCVNDILNMIVSLHNV